MPRFTFPFKLLAVCSAVALVSGCDLLPSSGSNTTTDNGCTSYSLSDSNGGCVAFKIVDIDRDGIADGIDLSNDHIAELLFVSLESNGARGLDVDGDNVADYYLLGGGQEINLLGRPEPYQLYNNPLGNGFEYRLVLGLDKNILGLDTAGNGNVGDIRLGNILNDSAKPSSNISITAGSYTQNQGAVISCSDNIACESIAFTLDGREPDFSGTGSVAVGNSAAVSLQAVIGASQQYLKFRARDRAGNMEATQTLPYSLDCASIPIARAGNPQFIQKSAGFTLADAGSSSSADSIVSWQWSQLDLGHTPDVTSGANLSASTVNLVAPNEVTPLRFQLEITDSNNCKTTDEISVLVMDDPNNALFVDGDNGSDSNSGSPQQPLANLRTALNYAINGEDIYVAARNGGLFYDESLLTLTVPNGVSLYGGFDANWQRPNSSLRTVIKGASTALSAQLIDATGMHIERFEIHAADSAATERSIGIRLKGAQGGANAVLVDNLILAGDVDISQRVDAAESSYGLHASLLDSITLSGNQVRSGRGGFGHHAAMAAAYASRASAGGNANDSIAGNGASSGSTTQAGTTGGTGSSWPGSGSGGQNKSCYGQTIAGGSGGSGGGGSGSDGNSGNAGTDGAPASVVGLGLGQLDVAGFVIAAAGAQGENGLPGCGGTGGGGAAGDALVKGGGGGGGGAGGGGGTGGLAGGGGGASIAVALLQINNIELSHNTILTVAGGDGGNGSAGTLGQIGGNGGAGDAKVVIGPGYPGGDGGSGGNGGSGGAASGGGGGAAIGILIDTASTITLSANSIASAAGGSGGQGGNADTSLYGEQGYSYAIYGINLGSPSVSLLGNLITFTPSSSASGIANNPLLVP